MSSAARRAQHSFLARNTGELTVQPPRENVGAGDNFDILKELRVPSSEIFPQPIIPTRIEEVLS